MILGRPKRTFFPVRAVQAQRSTWGSCVSIRGQKRFLSGRNFSPFFRNLDSRTRHKLVKLRIRSKEDARRQMHAGLTVLCGCWRLWVVTLWEICCCSAAQGVHDTETSPVGRGSGWNEYVSARRRRSRSVHRRDRMSFTISTSRGA
jgi:hypothetical protein